METFCRVHGKIEQIIGFERDNPILECGVVKTYSEADNKIPKCGNNLNRLVLSWAISNGLAIGDATNDVLEYFTSIRALAKCYNMAA